MSLPDHKSLSQTMVQRTQTLSWMMKFELYSSLFDKRQRRHEIVWLKDTILLLQFALFGANRKPRPSTDNPPHAKFPAVHSKDHILDSIILLI